VAICPTLVTSGATRKTGANVEVEKKARMARREHERMRRRWLPATCTVWGPFTRWVRDLGRCNCEEIRVNVERARLRQQGLERMIDPDFPKWREGDLKHSPIGPSGAVAVKTGATA
jgi:hypothetical protein